MGRYYYRVENEVQVEKFEYTIEGIQRVKEFLGEAFLHVNKHRHPTAIGYVTMKSSRSVDGLEIAIIAHEGEYIIKDSTGKLSILTAEKFNATYVMKDNNDDG